jgi:hypothetical protein
MTKKTDEGPAAGIRPALGIVAAVGAVLTVGALALFPVKTGLSVLVGALVGVSNLWVLAKIVEALLTPDPDEEPVAEAKDTDSEEPAEAAESKAQEPKEPKKAKSSFSGAWGALAAVKMLVLFGGTWILMTRGLVDPMGLLVGYGSLPIGVALSGVVAGLRPPKPSKRPKT